MIELFLSKFLGIKYVKSALLKSLKCQLALFLHNGERIKFPSTLSPKVSIIIPVYNGAHHTLRCLKALSLDRSVAFEVIVFDDGSSDETDLLLARCENLIVIKGEKNSGSIKAVNAAANRAIGQFLLLMNNDATLISGTIADALDVFQSEKNVGAVGARIVQPDGLLQEAGCMIFQNATTNGYLRFSKHEDPRAMFMRDVDYCSAMFFLIGRDLFLECGGFDEIYSPAYFEETDFCMKLRSKGLRTIYDPSILVEHFEFGSHQSSSGRKLIAERRPIFLSRWKKHLEQEGFGISEHSSSTFLNATRLVPRPRILLIFGEASPQHFSESFCELIHASVLHSYHVTLFIPELTPYPWSDFHKSFNKRIEITFGTNTASLESLLKQRIGYFDLCMSCGNKGTNLAQDAKDKKIFKKNELELFEGSQAALLDRLAGIYSH
jgi:O-antigen biosynthesis protein